jgi:hypothetical protein
MALTLIPTEQVDERAALRKAWEIVHEAYKEASRMPGVPEEEHQRFVRCARKTGSLLGHSPFDVVQGGV